MSFEYIELISPLPQGNCGATNPCHTLQSCFTGFPDSIGPGDGAIPPDDTLDLLRAQLSARIESAAKPGA